MSISTAGTREDLAVCAEIWEKHPEVTAWVREHGPAMAQQMVPGLCWARTGEEILASAQAVGVRLVLLGDLDYPDRLAAVPDAPVGLWVHGDVSILGGACVAVTGSRAASHYGQAVAEGIGGGLAEAGVNVVTGGAFGIDSAATQGAILGCGGSSAGGRNDWGSVMIPGLGRPVVVLASGVDVPYPSAHKPMLAKVAEVGAVVSPWRPGSTPTRDRFARRARTIAALSDAVTLVEAGLRSGALTTAREALTLERPVGVVPGPVTSATSDGCHAFLREHAQAHLVTGAPDVLEILA